MRFVAAGCFSLAVLAAGPDRLASQPGLGPLAKHFDSLAMAEFHKPDRDLERVNRLILLAFGLSNGSVPGQVSMSIAGRPMVFEIVGVQYARIDAVGWHDMAGDTLIAIAAPTDSAESALHVALFRGTTVDSGTAWRPAFTLNSSMGDTVCTYFRLLLQTEFAPGARCNVGSATLTFATLSDHGTFIASPPVTFGLTRLVIPKGP